MYTFVEITVCNMVYLETCILESTINNTSSNININMFPMRYLFSEDIKRFWKPTSWIKIVRQLKLIKRSNNCMYLFGFIFHIMTSYSHISGGFSRLPFDI